MESKIHALHEHPHTVMYVDTSGFPGYGYQRLYLSVHECVELHTYLFACVHVCIALGKLVLGNSC